MAEVDQLPAGSPTATLPAEVPYRSTGIIGDGATAVVHRATHVAHTGEAAVKVFRQPFGRYRRRLFAAECELQWRLSDHPNIVRLLHASSPAADLPWTVMPLYERSLAEALREGVPPFVGRRWALDLVRGLAAVHTAGFVHRDVKPGNILVRDGVAALSDFGSVISAEGPVPDRTAGTPRWTAPEVRAGGAPSYRSDVWAAAAVVRALVGPDPEPALAGVLVRSSSYDPGDRPADATELLAMLTTVLTAPDLDADVDVAEAVTPIDRSVRRRRPVARALAATLAVAVVAAVTWTVTDPAGRGLIEIPGQRPLPSATAAPTVTPTAAARSVAASSPDGRPDTDGPSPTASVGSPSTGPRTRETGRPAAGKRTSSEPAKRPEASTTNTSERTAPPDDEPAPAPRVDLATLPPVVEATIARGPTGAATSIQFVNERAVPVVVYWLADQRHEYRRLESWQSYVQPTWANHVWVVTDTDGNALLCVSAQEVPGRVVVT